MKKLTLLSAGVIALVVLITYFPALKIYFIVPDWSFLERAARFDFQQQLVQYFDPRLQTYGFRPLQGFQFYAEYLLFGDDSSGYHLFHILFHLINALLLFAIIKRLSNRWQLAFVSAVLFATLPAYSVAVMWVGVADPLTLPFYLLTILWWVIHLQTRQARFYWFAVGAFLMTMMGKEVVVFLPLVLFLIDRLLIASPSKLSDLVRRYQLFVLLLIPYLIFEYLVQRNGAFVSQAGYSFGPQIGVNLVQYLAVLVFPWLLDAPTSPLNYVWLALAVVLFLVALVRTRSRTLTFLGAAALLGILPVVGFQLSWFAPRYLYIPGIVPAILLACPFEAARRVLGRFRWSGVLASSVLGALLIANGSLITKPATDLYEVTRQIRVPFRDIERAHPVFDPDTYIYFLHSGDFDAYYLSVMFLLRYGKGVTVESLDGNQIPHWHDHSQAYLYYFSETDKPIEVNVEKSLNLHSSLSMPLQFQAPIRLEGFDVAVSNVRHGEILPLLLDWRATGPIDKDYTVFVHLVDENGQMVAGNDTQPREGRLPTSSWQVNQLVVDAVSVPITDEVPSGNKYALEVGLYYLPTLERVEILDAAGHPLGTSVMIGPFSVSN